MIRKLAWFLLPLALLSSVPSFCEAQSNCYIYTRGNQICRVCNIGGFLLDSCN